MKVVHILTKEDAPAQVERLILSLHEAHIEQALIKTADAPYGAEVQKAKADIEIKTLKDSIQPLQKFRLRRLIAQQEPDIILCWTPRAAALVGNGGRKGNKPTPVVIGWLGGDHDLGKYKQCSHVIGATKDIVAHIIKNGVPAESAHLIPMFAEVAATPPIDRSTLATPREAKVLLSLSRLHPSKGLDVLLTALQYMPECIAWLAGEGPARQDLENLAKKLGVIDRVRFLGRRSDHAALLRAADVCVLPSRHETTGSIIPLTWAAGTLLAACASSGVAALVENDVTGLLVPVDDARALVGALRRALDDEYLRRRLVSQGYAAYIKEYTREAVTRRWMQLYKSMV
jgi:glycosyltransferase involved in cell wall biosynthesis